MSESISMDEMNSQVTECSIATSQQATKIHICSQTGTDAASGSESSPFQTLQAAVIATHPSDSSSVQFFTRTTAQDPYVEVAKSALKKAKNYAEITAKKVLNSTGQAASKTAEEQARLDTARSITIAQDASLPVAIPIKISGAIKARDSGTRVSIQAWVHRLRRQGKSMMFVVLRDGTGFVQCLMQDALCQTFDGVTLTVESTVRVFGTIIALPDGKSAPDGHEMKVDYWEVIHKAPEGEESFDTLFNKEASVDVLLDQRHLVLRG
jgi:asparaginyl-tRNA synthetase